MTVSVYSGQYRQGNPTTLTPGVYANIGFNSTNIPKGYEIHIGENLNRVYLILGHGDYSGSELYRMLWGVLNCNLFPYVEVKYVGDKPSGLLVARDKYGEIFYYLPYGRSSCGACFKNDCGEYICLPEHVTAQVWEDGDFTGDTATYNGNNGQRHHLGSLVHRVSAIEIKCDDIDVVGAPILDHNSKQDLGNSETIGATGLLDNSGSSTTSTLNTEVSVSASSTAETNWSIGTETGITSETTIGTGEASPVKVEQKFGLSFSFSTSNGGSQSHSTSKTITQAVSSEVNPYSQKRVELILKKSKAKYNMKQLMRNSKTRKEFYIDGVVILDMVTDTTVRVVDV